MHNLFGDTDSVNIYQNADGSVYHAGIETHDTIEDMLRYVHLSPEELMTHYRDKVASAKLSARERAAAPAPRLGTGHGERETSYVSNTSFERRSRRPDEVITIRYDSRQNLIAAGIIANPVQQPVPRPFPESVRYTPDPPAWR